MLLSVGVEDGAETSARAAVAQAAREASTMFRGWSKAWAARVPASATR